MGHPNEMFCFARQIAGGTVKNAYDFAVLCSPQFFKDTSFETSTLKNNLRSALDKLTYLAYLNEKSRIALAKREIAEKIRENTRVARRMIKKVKANKAMFTPYVWAIAMWSPPTEVHKELKEFMLDEIKGYTSLSCDLEYWQNFKSTSSEQTPVEHAEFIVDVTEMLALTYDREIDRLEEAESIHDIFMQQLRASFHA